MEKQRKPKNVITTSEVDIMKLTNMLCKYIVKGLVWMDGCCTMMGYFFFFFFFEQETNQDVKIIAKVDKSIF